MKNDSVKRSDNMFVGRTQELLQITNELTKDSCAILIYGKRKVGKTTLIKKATENSAKTVIYYECVKDTIENNVANIFRMLKEHKLVSEYTALPNNTFIELMKYLDSLNQKLVFVIDEYPYLKEFEKSETVDSTFQVVIDNYLKNINLIISGSHIGMMKDLIEEKNALFGRFSLKIALKELNYLEASEFYKDKTPYDKVAFYSVFGGSPFINSFVNPNLSLKENIVATILNPNSPVYLYASNLLLSDLSNSSQINRVLASLKNGKKHYSELEIELDKNKTGLLSKILRPVLDAEIVKKTAPINATKDIKKATYEINDNLLRFYYAYIYSMPGLLNVRDHNIFFDDFIEPSLPTFVSYRFEDIAKNYLWLLFNKKGTRGIVDVGSYYYNDSVEKKNGEFDVAVLKTSDKVDIYEVKYLQKPVNQKIVNKELQQIKDIKNIKVDKVGFISINGFEKGIKGTDYLIDGQGMFLI